MSSRNRVGIKVKVTRCAGTSRSGARNGRCRDARRGVLLLVVLSLLVLFMLIGTAFLMSSNQYREAAKDSAKHDRVGSYPTRKLDQAVMQLLRDTDNPNSVVHYHSLLRDLYGADGFEAVVYSPADGISFNASVPAQQVSRFSAATAGTVTNQLGPTQGQLIDIYVRALAYSSSTNKSADDPLTPNPPTNESTLLNAPDARHVLKLELDPNGQPQTYTLPVTKGYFNGGLLTITSGPAAGQSTRIVDYEHIPNFPAAPTTPTGTTTHLFRFRVMAFARADGLPLQINSARPPELGDLAGATFVVNGRPFNGTGAGLNPMAAAGTARLNAVETIWIDRSDPANKIYPEIALTPNSTFFIPSDPVATSTTDELGARYKVQKAGPSPTVTYEPLNPKNVAVAARRSLWKYPSFAGGGDTDESYDAADFQNMCLALQTVTPRPRGRVVHEGGSGQVTLEVDDPTVRDSRTGAFINANTKFLRLDLEDLPLPSFHRPELFNYWYHWLFNSDWLKNEIGNELARTQAILQPYKADGTLQTAWVPNDAIAGQITALKRKISMRPLREDHPHFTGSNPSARVDLSSQAELINRNGQIAIPFWEAVGPWDVDNDNDGVPDSVWVDLGDPITQAENGTLYKPLYAFLVLDLDSRLNINAHGSVDDVVQSNLDPTIPAGETGNLAHDFSPSAPAGLKSTNQMAKGMGWGPADISLRPLFPLRDPDDAGNRGSPFDVSYRVNRDADGDMDDEDNYAMLLAGRRTADGRFVVGRYGFDNNPGDDFTTAFHYEAAAGITGTSPSLFFSSNNTGPPDLHAQLKLFGYPQDQSQLSAFSNPPDLMGRYALGIDPTGQPVLEVGSYLDQPTSAPQPIRYRPLVADSPYELDLSGDRRFDSRVDQKLIRYNPSTFESEYIDLGTTAPVTVAGVSADTDDAPFAAADLERILRSYDADAGVLPDRLWNVVDSFDPVKLLENHSAQVLQTAQFLFNDPSLSTNDQAQMLAAAQQMAAIPRRLVTTDSYDLPVPATIMPSYVSALGPDGAPGIALDDSNPAKPYDDDPDGPANPLLANGVPNDPSEIGTVGTDDFQAVTGHEVTHATISDLLHYRVFLKQRKKYIQSQGLTEPLTLMQQQTMLPVIYTTTNVIFNGESFVDANGNGVWDKGETWTDLPAGTGNNAYDPPLVAALLAQDVIAGKRMDLNRPFGDGRDNGDWQDNGDGIDNDSDGVIDEAGELGDKFFNGIVDEPQEAGEPFLDEDGDGKWDIGEPFIDVFPGDADGDGNSHDGSRDHLWNGLTAESITFDYTNGHGEPLHPAVLATLTGTPTAVTVRNLSSQGRQLYARQLYCLMLLLVDEGYVETPNAPTLGGDNLNLELILQAIAAANNRPGNPNDADVQLAVKKLTARRIAQWAINCADFRDADSIMTPFEYDENPWDGWGVPDRDGVNIPLDGDPATNENGNESMLETDLPTKNMSQVIDWKATAADPNHVKVLSNTLVTGPRTKLDQTRGLVWGTERPELLITETLAFHDRRCTDERFAGSPAIDDAGTPPTTPPDFDLDQRLKPRGSLFVELYNPWSPDSHRAAEFYGAPNPPLPVPPAGTAPDKGVMLNRLSDLGAFDSVSGLTKKSPVWRMAVLQDPFSGRIASRVFNPEDNNEVQAAKFQVLSTDPDDFGIDIDRVGERFVYFTTGDVFATATVKTGTALNPGDESDANRDDDNTFAKEYDPTNKPYTNNPNLRVRVPPLPFIKIGNQPIVTGRRYFIARTDQALSAPNDKDVEIAPILPGRYAVVGSSGTQLSGTGRSGNSTTPTLDGGITSRFVTSLSRLEQNLAVAEDGRADRPHRQFLGDTRRIELWASKDPTVQQVLVGQNGGPEFIRRNVGSPIVNLTDTNLDGIPDPGDPNNSDPNPANRDPSKNIVEPCVAIPVEDLNISEPVEGYISRKSPQGSVVYRDLYAKQALSRGPLNTSQLALNLEGEWEFQPPYDHPLDLEFELVRNGTTQNYKSLHLQRLADPTQPWNPPPFNELGEANAMYKPDLPVNPYLTVDSQSVDLTAFNGASLKERSLPSERAKQPFGAQQFTNADDFSEDRLQSNLFAPFPANSLATSPDHVLWGVNYVLVKEKSGMPYMSPKDFRAMIVNSASTVEQFLSKLENSRNRGSSPQDLTNRGILLTKDHHDQYGRDWTGQWGWSLYKRVLPDDEVPDNRTDTTQFRQWLHLQSLERGAHDSTYYIYPQPNNFFTAYPNAGIAPQGWTYDPQWVPRLLWKQERPNVRLFLAPPGKKVVEASDLKNAVSHLVLSGRVPANDTRLTTMPTDDIDRNALAYQKLSPSHPRHVVDFVLGQTLGFANEVFVPELDRTDGTDTNAVLGKLATDPIKAHGAPEIALSPSSSGPAATVTDTKEVNNSPRAPALINDTKLVGSDKTMLTKEFYARRQRLMASTYPWLAWNDRPYVSADEIMQVPATSSSILLHDYSVLNPTTVNPYNGTTINNAADATATARIAGQHGIFGHLLNFFLTADKPAGTYDDPAKPPGTKAPLSGAPNYHRILNFVEVPSRFVGTETLLSPEVFNDVPGVVDTIGTDITNPADPRYLLQPPFNKVSRERDPGRVNINTVIGRRTPPVGANPAHIWSEVYDGVMHRYQDNNPSVNQLGQLGPAWRDVVLSRRGYAQVDAGGTSIDKPGTTPDTFAFGLNSNFPSFFSNPFRSSDAGDLVPITQMLQFGVDASTLRVHPYRRGTDGSWGSVPDSLKPFGDVRDAGYGTPNEPNDPSDPNRDRGGDALSVRVANGGIPDTDFTRRDLMPLFSEARADAAIDAGRNSYMMYQPMTRLGNLVTEHSNVFAVWVTVGYFEVERAPDWNDSDSAKKTAIRAKFGATTSDTDPATIAGRVLYDRVYPEGYMLGQELGSEIGNTKRQRAFYIIDRTEPVGFKPGEDLNDERAIRVRRRIE